MLTLGRRRHESIQINHGEIVVQVQDFDHGRAEALLVVYRGKEMETITAEYGDPVHLIKGRCVVYCKTNRYSEEMISMTFDAPREIEIHRTEFLQRKGEGRRRRVAA